MPKKLSAKQLAENKANGIKKGQPTKYKERFAQEAYGLCELGATDPDLATFFRVSLKTIDNWKNAQPNFLHAINEAKFNCDHKIVRSLHERASGYSCTEQKLVFSKGEPKTINIDKHYPPDPTSMIFWLKNRKPKEWRDKQEIELSEKPLKKVTRKRYDGTLDETT